jgi:spermidine synthase
LLLVLFIGSGCSALIYEVVWLQSLQLVIGSSGVSLGVLLGTFMGGMCLGSLVLPRVISPRRHPLRVYGLIELGIGAAGIAVLFGMPHVHQFYATHVHHGLASILMRGAVCALCLLPPTLLMGATLPAIARWVKATPEGVSWLGFFYGCNIAGAVFGCLLAGFYLLRVYDAAVATYVAATLNLSVALIALLLAGRTVHQVPVGRASPHDVPMASEDARPTGAGIVYVVIGLSGLSALGAEVVWTRNLSLLLGGTVYTFSIILAVFLTGLGIGSSIGSVISRHSPRPRAALGGCQLLLMGAIAWAAYALAKSLPYWPIDPSLSQSPWLNFQLDLMRCAWAVLPGAILWGASFPLALASVVCSAPVRASEETPDGVTTNEPGRLVGGVYAANTVGAIVGSLAFSMVLIPWLGTRGSQRVMIGVAALSVLLILASALRGSRAVGIGARLAGAGAVGVLAMTILLIWHVPTTPWGLTAYGRYMATQADHLFPGITEEKDVPSGNELPDIFCIYAREGMSVSVAVTESTSGIRSFHGAGKVQASNGSRDMRLQRMLGHIPALVHGNPESVLVVACGAGVTAGSFVVYPSVKRIVICDIEPLVPKFVAPKFKKENYDVVGDPRTEVVCDDGRHFVGTTQEKFDIITSDPIDPWVKGCAALNTLEYYTMCKEHLNPGGVMALWMPLYESNPQTAKSLIATFFRVFPNGILWSNDSSGDGYDAVLFGQVEPTQINMDEWQQRLSRPEYLPVVQSLTEVGFPSVDSLLATYAGQASRLQEWMQDAQINTDLNLRLQYLAGMSLNSIQGTAIFAEILRYYEFPDRLFLGSDDRVGALKEALERAGRSAYVTPLATPGQP